ncbi:MAG TPA: DUF615 domain-containing protein, partial [Gammaproteobacteria bacterium]|nr:DUF615 domain-containing protein [Gammaproteobacteria bacterium]
MHQDDERPAPSKTQRKRDAEALQALGARLVDLAEAEWRRLELPDDLVQALREARKIRSHGARKRQLQYIGKLMRGIEVQAVRDYFEQRGLADRLAAERHQHLERLRDTLIDEGDAALGEVLAEFPGADRQQLRQLVRQARREREHG